MHHQKFEMKSLVTCKKEELLDQLLSSIEEEDIKPGDSPRGRIFWIILTYHAGDTWEQPRPISEEDKKKLTRPFRKNEVPRTIDPGSCRDWAIESRDNWLRIIPEGKELLLDCAQGHNDSQFLEVVKRFENQRGR
jgi:hypothetical protein